MIKEKYRTFDRALLYSYQSADVMKVDGENEEIYKALINPDKVKQNYDDKIISIDYSAGYKAGDIFKWIGTNTYWIIYLQELTEDAYFRAEIRRCKYQIQWINQTTKERESTWAYVRGPVETQINSIQKAQVRVDVPNWSLEIYVPDNPVNRDKFERYSRFLFDGRAWQVEVVDKISIEGVIQINAEEYYINNVTDDKKEDLVDAFEVVPVVPKVENEEYIQGPTFIKPQTEVFYTCDTIAGGTWSILESKRPVIIKENEKGINIKWNAMTSGQFTLVYTLGHQTFKKVIVVESLF